MASILDRLKKILPFLENNVQWIALVLGFAFFLYIGWTYVVQNPVKIQANPGDPTTAVTPGTVDTYVNDNYAAPLMNKLQSQPLLPDPNFKPVDKEPTRLAYEDLKERLGPRQSSALANSELDWNSLPVSLNLQPGSTTPTNLVKALPATPPLQYLNEEFLRTAILNPNPAGPQHLDLDSITTFWRLPVIQLGANYAATLGDKIAPGNQQTMPLHAVLIRQELIGPNNWSNGTPITPVVPTPPGTPQPAWPPAQGAAEVAYKGWAQVNSATFLVAPQPFFTIAYTDRPDLNWLTYAQFTAPPPAPAAVAPAGPQSLVPARPVVVTPVATPAAPAPALADLPNGLFSPAKGGGGLNNDTLVWFIDDTVLPGHTYRYQVQYTLYNPAYGFNAGVADPKMAAQFGIDSPMSGWSAPVTIPLKTRFWIATAMKQPVLQPQRQQLQTNFDVYTWHDGLWHFQPFNAIPGDEIGANLGDHGDFTSHWTFLDLIFGHGGGGLPAQGLVVADFTGEIVARDVAQDENSPAYKQFQKDFAAQPAAAGTPAQPVAPPPTAAATPGAGG